MPFLLDLNLPLETIKTYLKNQEWLNVNEEIIHLEKPGEGNMNVVVRIKTSERSFILKQSRPFVQKYQQIAAPLERIVTEHQFYLLTKDFLQSKMPQLLHFDKNNHVLMLEDLGEGSDYTYIYQKKNQIQESEVFEAIQTISKLHNSVFSEVQKVTFPDNLALRKLNYEHLFVYPFMIENGFNLDTIQDGLQAVAMLYKTDETLKLKLETLGNQYLSIGKTLIHGDYYPGSWLQTKGNFKVIDPEFSFFGLAEYDLGVMIAHLKMAQIGEDLIEKALEKYQKPLNFNENLMQQFTGMEILRRIIGLAQLPLELTLQERKDLLIEAKQLVENH